MDDAQLIFDWSNDPLVRQQSFQNNPIVWEDHLVWLSKKIKSEIDVLWIVEQHEQPVGFVRFENITEHPTIGILVDQAHRGQGLASQILTQASASFTVKFGKPIYAYIKQQNTASVKAFERAGYVQIKQTEIQGVPSLEYLKQI